MTLYSKAQWGWACERWVEGYAIRDVARFLGCEPNGVRYHIKKSGLIQKPRPQMYAENRPLTPLAQRTKEFNDLA